MWIMDSTTNPSSYNISLIRGNTCLILLKNFNQRFQREIRMCGESPATMGGNGEVPIEGKTCFLSDRLNTL